MIIFAGFKIGSKKREKSLFIFSGINIILIIAVFSLYYYPLGEYSFYPPCPWYKMTETYCPGCGTVRGFNSMLNGNFFSLIDNNILAFVSLPFLGYAYLTTIVEAFASYHLPSLFLSRNELLFIAFVIVAYGIARNFIPFLAPEPLM